MVLPNIKSKRAIYIESREARAVIIENIDLEDDLVVISVKADSHVTHMRTWLEDEKYKAIKNGENGWNLSCQKDFIVLHEDFAQAPQCGWQLLIDEETVELFAQKDDDWSERWF